MLFSGLARCQVTWLWVPDRIRRWFLLALIAMTLSQCTVGYLFPGPQEALACVLHALLSLPVTPCSSRSVGRSQPVFGERTW